MIAPLKNLILCSLAFYFTSAVAQDSVHLKPRGKDWVKAFIAPAVLYTAGVLSVPKKYAVQDWRNENYPNFKTGADDWIQYVPIVAVYGFNAVGIKGKNDFANRNVLLAKSAILMTGFFFAEKYIHGPEIRPDSSNYASFPSGHTIQAFAAAAFLSKEYGHISVWYSIGGYTVATGVGVMRILNNKHWLPDVLIGAATGILSVNLVYLTHQYHWGKSYRNNKKRNQVLLLPTYGRGPGLYFCLKLK